MEALETVARPSIDGKAARRKSGAQSTPMRGRNRQSCWPSSSMRRGEPAIAGNRSAPRGALGTVMGAPYDPGITRAQGSKDRRRHAMPEAAKTEFWKDMKAIEKVFQPDALPEVYISKIASADDRYFVPITDTVSSRPVWISPSQNRWCDVLMAKKAGFVNRHYHPHEVFAYTISGKWGYLEHDWTATAGDFVYETPGEAHTLVAYDHAEPMRVFFTVKGPLIWLDEQGEACGYFDVHNYIGMCKAHYETVGLGAELIERLYR
jgi:2,4'-dihydroxyacetophenone dioxygenase